MTVTGASALPRTCSSVAMSDGGGTTAVCGEALGGVGTALPPAVALAVVPGLDVVVSGPVALGVAALGFAGSVLAPDVVLAVVPGLDVDVSVPAAFCVDALGPAGWAFTAGEVFVAVLALGAGVGALVPLDGTSRFKK